jgi:hypothetical protein
MALSVQDPVLIWQKVAKALAGANPATQAAFRDLKNYITTQGGNPQLQFIPYTAAQAIVNLGTSLVGGACTLYGWYGKTARTSGTTAAFENLHDAADNSATTTTMDTADSPDGSVVCDCPSDRSGVCHGPRDFEHDGCRRRDRIGGGRCVVRLRHRRRVIAGLP